MTETETQLLHAIEPKLRAAIPIAVLKCGCEDAQELIQDGVVLAIMLHQQATTAGKTATASSLAHYTLLLLRAGRRSTGYKKNDVMHPAAQSNGRSHLQSMEEPIHEVEYGQELTLHDCLAAPVEDPATIAARRLDWETVLGAVDRTAKAILSALAEGTELTLLVTRLQRSRSSLQSDKVRLGRLIQEQLGDDILAAVQSRPAWTATIDAFRELDACRAERRAA
jgi:hypothetical protein